MAAIANKPSLIEWGKYRFMIMDAPKNNNLQVYIKYLRDNNVTDVVRACEQTYDAEEMTKAGITLHEMCFDDGRQPPETILAEWLSLVDARFQGVKEEDPNRPCIAVHCVAGLGRAPLLIAIALIEAGYDSMAVVNFIRERRRGAINNKQLEYIRNYQLRPRANCNCIIM